MLYVINMYVIQRIIILWIFILNIVISRFLFLRFAFQLFFVLWFVLSENPVSMLKVYILQLTRKVTGEQNWDKTVLHILYINSIHENLKGT